MKTMTVTRHSRLGSARPGLATLGLGLLPLLLPSGAVVVAGGPADASPQATAAAPATPRRSHIQPVGEIAAASRHADTLGLRLARASEVLRQQLALARGAGLVVEEVTPGSDGEKAGFRQHDVLVLLDDQMLMLPEQLTALLEAADGTAAPQCTLLRGGVKVTVPLGLPGRLPPAATARAADAPLRTAPLPTAAMPMPAIRQTAAKQPSVAPRLRAPASTLALVQSGPDDRPGRAIQTAASAPAAAQTLVRNDPDYQLKLTRGDETRLVVLDTNGRIVFNDEIDTPDNRSLVPVAVRQRVEEMERALEPAGPVAEIGRLDVAPVEIR